MILNGKNLGERQKDLNSRVNEAVANNVNFDVIKAQKEVSDVDVFFKIDVAAKYKNTEYILKILKSEDSLHIKRALKKCDWLFDDEHSYIINIDYLHNDVFPHMSTKMKQKMLSSITKHVKDETQAETFYNYCKNENLQEVAYKFLLLTSEAFKLSFITNCDDKKYAKIGIIKRNLKAFLGNSLTLAEAHLEKTDEAKRAELLVEMSYLYFVSNEKYLDMLEKYYQYYDSNLYTLGKEVTKDIAMKHKNRVLTNPEIYLRKLDMKTLLKHSNLEEVKQYAVAKLSDTAQRFWRGKYWKTYKLILSAIPAEEKFEFVRDIFTKKYPGEKFETSEKFYTTGGYNLMTREQKIEATKNFESEEGNMSRMKRNVWYKNVHFDKAFSTFEEKMINNTNRKTRTNLLVVLIKACKSQQDLEKVLNFYDNIYNEEKVSDKEKFLNAIFIHCKEDIFDLDTNCWTVLQRMLLDQTVSKILKSYEITVYLCHILHKTEVPEELKTVLDTIDLASFNTAIKQLEGKQRTMAYEYLLQYYVDKLYEVEGKDNDYDIEILIRHHVHSVINLITFMDKSKDDIPEVVQKYLLSDWEVFRHYDILKDEQNNFMKRLKKDASTVKHFQTIKENLTNDPDFNLIPVLRKLKIYFSHDIAKDFVNFFKDCLSQHDHETFDIYAPHERRVVETAVIGIFMLADESYKKEMMLKYVPVANRIDYIDMEGFHLCIQEAICRFGYYSRPPLPISSLKLYLKGDYAKRCLPTIGSLFANLTATSCLQLAQTLLKAPSSSLRFSFPLVFNHLSVDVLKEVVMNIWRNAKSKSVRRDWFTLMYETIQWQNEETQVKLLECLKEMVMSFRENDDRKCFEFLDNDELIPHNILGGLLEAAWESVGKFVGFNSLKTTLISYIEYHISLINKQYVRGIVVEHIQNTSEVDSHDLDKAKWDLVAAYLLFTNDEDTNNDLDLFDIVMAKLIDKGHYKLKNFVEKLVEISVEMERKTYSQANSLLSRVLSRLLDIESLEGKYFIMWDLKLAIVSNKVMDMARSKLQDKTLNHEIIAKDIEYFFAKEIGEVVKELIEKEQYQTRFLAEISEKVCDLNSKMKLFSDFNYSLHWFSFTVFLVEGLINSNNVEIQMLALNILRKNLPEELGSSRDYYNALIDRIKNVENSEVQYFLSRNFSNNKIKRRRL